MSPSPARDGASSSHRPSRLPDESGREDERSSKRHRSPESRQLKSDDDRVSKRRRREEKRMRKELRRLRRVARDTLPKNRPSSRAPAARPALDEQATSSDEAESARKLESSGIFVWKKKNEQLRKQGVRVSTEDEHRRKKEIEDDLERTKERRAQREAERAEWEAEQVERAREREQAENADWHTAEQSFLGEQHLLRQAIRLRDGRPTDADQLARNMRVDLLDVPPDARSPPEFLDDRERAGMTAADADALLEAVAVELDCLADFPTATDTSVFTHATRLRWWTSVEAFLSARARSMREQAAFAAAPSGLHASVLRDVDALLAGKSRVELSRLEREVSARLAGGNDAAPAAIDPRYGEVDFWAAALREVRCRLARATLRELTDLFAGEKARLRAAAPRAVRARRGAQMEEEGGEGARGMGDDEEAFADEAAVPESARKKKAYVPGAVWNDKYRPRKPRYYNRVHTGYDWTKYNRTHYDHNNPPPKTVQGYKFNIFYPDLMDKSATPSFTISKTDNQEVCIITFTAGPPYEDIAFKIVNRQWEQSHRKGYRCSFDRGILHLWFNFQRYRYRR